MIIIIADGETCPVPHLEGCSLPGFWMSVKVDAQDDATRPPGKMERVVEAADEFRNGFSDGFLWPATSLPGA
jgi:hypothetical protein